MKSSKAEFIKVYEEILTPISKEIKQINGFEKLYGPHIPGVGDNYWKVGYEPKIAFIGKDVGEGKLIEESLGDLNSFVKYSSDLMNGYDVLEWKTRQCTIGGMIINILSEVYDIDEQKIFDRERNDLLASFVWAQVNCILNYQSWKKKSPDLDFDVWQNLKEKCDNLNSMKLLLRATDFDVAILTCWDVNNNYLDLPYEVLSSETHLRLLKLLGYNKFVVHTCHPTHWPKHVSKNPFYARLGKIFELIKETKLLNNRSEYI